jgi:hypothetical protein
VSADWDAERAGAISSHGLTRTAAAHSVDCAFGVIAAGLVLPSGWAFCRRQTQEPVARDGVDEAQCRGRTCSLSRRAAAPRARDLCAPVEIRRREPVARVAATIRVVTLVQYALGPRFVRARSEAVMATGIGHRAGRFGHPYGREHAGDDRARHRSAAGRVRGVGRG